MRRAWIFALIFGLRPPPACAAPGDSTAGFLQMGFGGRALAMGEAFTAVADDATAVYWNPAGLAQLGRQEFAFMHGEHVEGIRHEFLGYALPLGRQRALGARIAYLSAGEIEGMDASGASLGRLPSSYDLAFGASYGHGLAFGLERPHRVLVGIGVEAIRKVVAGDSAFGPAFDLGAIYRPPDPRLPSFGLALQHLGPALSFPGRSASLPRAVRFGLSKSWDVLRNPVRIAMDGVAPKDRAPYAALGLEYAVSGLFSLRFGYRSSDDAADGFRVGAGIAGRDVSIDYALVPFGPFGFSHRVSMSLRFGRRHGATAWEAEVERSLDRGRRRFARGELLEAYQEVRKVLGLMPLEPEALGLKSRLEAEYGALEADRRRFLVSEQLRLAREALKRSDLLEASGHLQLILSLDPGQEEARRELDSINATFEKLKQEQAAAAMTRAGLQSSRGEFTEAIGSYKLVLSLYPGDAKAAEGLREAQARLESAIRERRFSERRRETAKAYEGAVRDFERGRVAEAFELLSKILSEFPDNAEAGALMAQVRPRLTRSLLEQARALLSAGKLDEAVELLRRASSASGGVEEARRELGSAEEKLASRDRGLSRQRNAEGFRAYEAGELEKAVELWREALRLDPADEKLKEQIATALRELSIKKR